MSMGDAYERLTRTEQRTVKQTAKQQSTAKTVSGYCYNCNSYCYGDCGNYSPRLSAAQFYNYNQRNNNIEAQD